MKLSQFLKPHTFDEIYGQESLIGPQGVLRKMLEEENWSSAIFVGPPGCGKSSIATCIQQKIGLPYRKLNAAIHHKKDLEQSVQDLLLFPKALLFIDEIHTLSKAMQTYLLPYLEEDRILLIGMTTESVYSCFLPALRSRLTLFSLSQLTPETVEKALQEALHKINGQLQKNYQLSSEVTTALAQKSQGDLRLAYQYLELLLRQATTEKIDIEVLSTLPLCQEQQLPYTKSSYYALLSAFQKSIRGGDVDAALHYFVLLLEGHYFNEVCRRLIVIAYEDIGLANPEACQRTVTAVQAAKEVGLPEAKLILAHTIIDLSLSPKSNSALQALQRAETAIAQGKLGSIPQALQDQHCQGQGAYQSPHEVGFAKNQRYWPEDLPRQTYYEPKTSGKYERALAKQKESYDHYLK